VERAARARTCTEHASLISTTSNIRTEWASLDHGVIAAAGRQWRRRLSSCDRAKIEGLSLCSLCNYTRYKHFIYLFIYLLLNRTRSTRKTETEIQNGEGGRKIYYEKK